MAVDIPPDLLGALEETLGHEERLTEQLRFKLIQAKLLLTAGEAHFVGSALQEVQGVLEEIRGAENWREKAVTRLAAAINLSADEITLAYLAEHAPEPYRERFSKQRYRFMDLTSEVEQLTNECRRLAQANVDMIQGTLESLYKVTESLGTYDAAGRLQAGGRNPTRLDRAL